MHGNFYLLFLPIVENLSQVTQAFFLDFQLHAELPLDQLSFFRHLVIFEDLPYLHVSQGVYQFRYLGYRVVS